MKESMRLPFCPLKRDFFVLDDGFHKNKDKASSLQIEPITHEGIRDENREAQNTEFSLLWA